MEVGQKVKIVRLRERVPQDTINRLGQVGSVVSLKVVDGGLGAIVEFDDGYTTWFFDNELKLA